MVSACCPILLFIYNTTRIKICVAYIIVYIFTLIIKQHQYLRSLYYGKRYNDISNSAISII